MHAESRKLHIIEAVLKTENEDVLEAIETIVKSENAISNNNKSKGRFSDLLGVLTYEEAESMKKTIEENFEKINPDD
jgi:coenzyme F420-reducing hydrogenase beta subunit